MSHPIPSGARGDDATAQHSLQEWAARVSRCPYCGGPDFVQLTEWTATSDDDPENTATLTEYQCTGACEGRSFWA